MLCTVQFVLYLEQEFHVLFACLDVSLLVWLLHSQFGEDATSLENRVYQLSKAMLPTGGSQVTQEAKQKHNAKTALSINEDHMKLLLKLDAVQTQVRYFSSYGCPFFFTIFIYIYIYFELALLELDIVYKWV